MKKINISWNDIEDPTGYLFSFSKALSAVVKHSPFSELYEDVIATSGFAFRMWVSSDLCPSATSIWDFSKQKEWVENSGLTCNYIERLWNQDTLEEERRLAAIHIIKESIDNGLAVVAWDISGGEWGIITGYDDSTNTLSTLKIDWSEDFVAYNDLGKLEIPILSVLAITGKSNKLESDIIRGTIQMAISHLKGDEWCENAKGLDAYSELIHFIKEKLEPSSCWNLAYFLGTYASLKLYAYKFFHKYDLSELATMYKIIYDAWLAAYLLKDSGEFTEPSIYTQVISHLEKAYQTEQEALKKMETYLL